jgi:Adenylate and Guanylate cyclase catalytic domain
MKTTGIPGCIQVTERTRQLLEERYLFRERGRIQVKGKGEMRTISWSGATGYLPPVVWAGSWRPASNALSCPE